MATVKDRTLRRKATVRRVVKAAAGTRTRLRGCRRKPALHFFHEGGGALADNRMRSRVRLLVRWRGERHGHREGAAGGGDAADRNLAAVQLHELLDQGEADAAALEAAPARILYPVKALEDMGQLRGRDAAAGIGDTQYHVRALAPQARHPCSRSPSPSLPRRQ